MSKSLFINSWSKHLTGVLTVAAAAVVALEKTALPSSVYEVIPELVSFNSNHEPESVNYSLLSVLLLEEVKKLRIEVDALKNG